MNLCYIDDDEDDRSLFHNALNDLQYKGNLLLSDTIDSIFNRVNFKKQLPDLIFLDLNLKETNGLTCLKLIKAEEHLKEIPVIIFTGSFTESMARQAYVAGAHRFLRKPYLYSHWKRMICYFLRLHATGTLSIPKPSEFVVNEHTDLKLY